MGLNDIIYRSSPTQIPGTTWSEVDGSGVEGRALKTDGTMWVWGSTYYGSLGLNQSGSGAYYSSPVQVPGSYKKFSVGDYWSVSQKTDDTLWAVGSNDFGQFANSSEDAGVRRYSSPVQIPGTNWTDFRANIANLMLINTDGELWMQGKNFSGELGLNDAIYRSSPIQVPGTWSKLGSHGQNSSSAIKPDATLWSWGYNRYGGIGNNTSGTGPGYVGYSSPVQIPGSWDSTFPTSTGGGGGVKTDGTLWVWGKNDAGHLGLGDQVQYSSPVQIPGTWGSISCSGVASFYGTKS